MLGILLQAISSLFQEVSGSLGKVIATKQWSHLYALGFLNAVLTGAMYLAYVAWDPRGFVLRQESVPSLIVLCVLAVAQADATARGAALASRSTFNFIRTGTMPLLLAADLVMGYGIGIRQVWGIGLIVMALLVLSVNHGIERRGLGLVAFTAINAVLTISMYKWHISKWNSVAAEQLVLNAAIAAYFLGHTIRLRQERPFRLLRQRAAWAQTGANAVSGFIEGFAYHFAPASIILAAKRSFAVLWSILSGNKVFHEKKLGLKLAVFFVVAIGIVLIAVP